MVRCGGSCICHLKPVCGLRFCFLAGTPCPEHSTSLLSFQPHKDVSSPLPYATSDRILSIFTTAEKDFADGVSRTPKISRPCSNRTISSYAVSGSTLVARNTTTTTASHAYVTPSSQVSKNCPNLRNLKCPGSVELCKHEFKPLVLKIRWCFALRRKEICLRGSSLTKEGWKQAYAILTGMWRLQGKRQPQKFIPGKITYQIERRFS